MLNEDNSQHWLDRAKDARDRAGRLKDPTSQRLLLCLAGDYERFAELTGLSDAGKYELGPAQREIPLT